MAKHTSLFLPEEHVVLADWLNVDPVEKPKEETDVEEALVRLRYDREVYQYSQSDAAVASIVLERIHNVF